MAVQVRVENLRNVNRAFNAINAELGGDLSDGLERAAQPVKATAEALAVHRIHNLHRSPKWAEQKIAVSKATALVRMFPVKRSTKVANRKRPNFSGLMFGRAMEPALQQNTLKVTREVDQLLSRLGRKHGF